MDILSSNNVIGDLVSLKTSNSRHISNGSGDIKQGEKVVSNFAKMFNESLNEVNDLQIKSTELANKLAIDPESVDIHDVQIASEEAEMAILITKGVVERVIKAYKEITNLR